MNPRNATLPLQVGASAVITHRVSEAQQAAYEQWLQEIGAACRASEGVLDWHVIRPIAGYSETYSVIIRYDSEQHLKQWMDSEHRRRLISQVEALLTGQDSYQIKSGLDFWFTPVVAPTPPVRWKQFLITWSAIFPLVSLLPLLLLPGLRQLGLPANHVLDTLLVTGVVVTLMVYVVMPRYTKLVRRWLFK